MKSIQKPIQQASAMDHRPQFTLTLPNPDGTTIDIQTDQSIVIVGANGSGKTRLGTWIELNSPQKNLVHRISASKSLSMPDSTTPMSIDLASNSLLFGHERINPGEEQHYKTHSKYGNKPATFLQNDFSKLMAYLFSDETEENAKYKAAQKVSNTRIEPPLSRLDKLKEIWEAILPHRKLVIGGLKIETQINDDEGKKYNASEMSDGERVIFYLIGQCLAAPSNGIIVIDEPEIHLHKSIQQPLWRELEKARSDCLFVYLTHDVSFAASLPDSKNIWLKSFDGVKWKWELLSGDNNFPNELLLEIIGSRQPILFVEGENGSHDAALYRILLPKYLIIPRGSCEQVILSVKAFQANPQLTQMVAHGLIDRDRRVPTEIKSLESKCIFVLEVAEVESLFCTRELIDVISKRLSRDPVADFEAIKNNIFSRLKSELDSQISMKVSSEVKFKLNNLNMHAKGVEGIEQAINEMIQRIDVKDMYGTIKNEFDEVLDTSDYEGLLAIYNRKSLIDTVGGELGISPKQYAPLVIRLASNELNLEISSALRRYLGNIPLQ